MFFGSAARPPLLRWLRNTAVMTVGETVSNSSMKMNVMIYIAAPLLILGTLTTHTTGQLAGVNPQVALSLSIKLNEFSRSQITMELTVENTTSEEIYVAVNPADLYGKKGWYVDAGDSKESVMFLSSQVYQPPSSYVYSDETTVELKRVGPADTVVIPVVLRAPFKETDPPFAASIMTTKKVFAFEKVKRIVVSLGYLRADVVRSLDRRRVKGSEQVRLTGGRTKTLLDLQEVALTEIAVK